MKQQRYDVPTQVIASQAQTLLDQLSVKTNQPRIAALAEFGLDGKVFRKELAAAHEELVTADAAQERAKADYLKEANDDRAAALCGYKWKQRLEARVRGRIADVGDDDDLAGQFRFGQLRVPRARGVLNELRIVLPECEEHAKKLAPYGVTPAFVQEGWKILSDLGGTRESAAALKKRKDLTAKVQAAELKVSRLLDRLRRADEAYAMDHPQETTVFRLDLIRAEVARVKALREAQLAAHGNDEDEGEG